MGLVKRAYFALMFKHHEVSDFYQLHLNLDGSIIELKIHRFLSNFRKNMISMILK